MTDELAKWIRKLSASKIAVSAHLKNQPNREHVIQCLKEIFHSQNTGLWNAFSMNGGTLLFSEIASDGEAPRKTDYGATYDNADGQIHVDAEINYRWVIDTPYECTHELGHWLDDKACFFMPASGKRRQLFGFHSESDLWKRIKEWSGNVYYGETDEICRDLALFGYPEDDNIEFFAHAIARHIGPLVKEHKKSPLFAAYMDKVAALDITIMSQDKPIEEKFADRKKLYDALRAPLKTFLDTAKLDRLVDEYPSTTETTEAACKHTIQKCVEEGLDRLVTNVSESIGLKFTTASRHKDGKCRH